jgi:quinol monooxygenase YgiN
VSEPIVFVSHFRVKAGKVDAYKQLQHEIAQQLQADKPRTLAFLPYLTEDDSQLTIVHVFGDAEAMDIHFQGSDERSNAAYEVLQPDGWEIYGRPGEDVVDSMRGAAADSRVTLTLQPAYVAGFLRMASA